MRRARRGFRIGQRQRVARPISRLALFTLRLAITELRGASRDTINLQIRYSLSHYSPAL
jgi:hypothetical protein